MRKAMNKSKKLLTLEDLEQFYSAKKRSYHFSASNDADAIVVQVPGVITFSEDDYDPTLGLLPVHLDSCHILRNRNNSNISEEVMNQAIPSIYNRPILGYIQKLKDGSYDFAGHEMFINDEGEIEYEEIAVGTIPESCNAQLVYDKEKDKTYLQVDGYIYEEYTRAADILKEKKESKVSVELSLLDFSYDAKNKYLNINKFYFSGITILGVTRDGSETPIEEGMYGSNIKLKDFNKSNNSMFSGMDEDEHSKLIDALDRLNETLSKFNINQNSDSVKNYRKEEDEVEEVIKVNEEVTELETTEEIKIADDSNAENLEEKKEETVDEVTEEETNEEVHEESTEEVTETDTENETEEAVETPDVVEDEVEEIEEVEEAEVEDVEETEETDEVDDVEDADETEDFSKKDNSELKFSKTFELSHDDIRYALYSLLASYEEADNDWYWIVSVYDTYFVYQGCAGNYFGQKYKNENNNIAFDGERYELFAEFVTESEKAELETMRSNYSSILTELNSYKETEEIEDKMTVFSDEAYANYLETEEFKSLMSKENVKKFNKDELVEKADAALGKIVKASKTFSLNEEKKEKKPSFFAFARQESNSTFLDSLLNEKK